VFTPVRSVFGIFDAKRIPDKFYGIDFTWMRLGYQIHYWFRGAVAIC